VKQIDPSQIERQSHFALNTPMGTKMSLTSSGLGQDIWTFLVGMEKNRYILLRLPRELHNTVLHHDRFTVKFLKENLVYGFSSTVLHTVRHPFPLLFLNYPETVETLDLRNHERAICFLPVDMYWQSEQYPGHIIDLSRSGCRMVIDLTSAGQLSTLEKGISLFCSFKPGQEEIHAGCKIRNISRSHDRLVLGISFKELPEEYGRQLDLYVKQINEIRME
jgi:c-di-GMP-binding flagellar brake protein YcgR